MMPRVHHWWAILEDSASVMAGKFYDKGAHAEASELNGNTIKSIDEKL